MRQSGDLNSISASAAKSCQNYQFRTDILEICFTSVGVCSIFNFARRIRRRSRVVVGGRVVASLVRLEFATSR